MAAQGFNFARLAVFWDDLEPRPGHYSDRYLRKIAPERLVETMRARPSWTDRERGEGPIATLKLGSEPAGRKP